MRQLKPHLFLTNGVWACCSREVGSLVFGGSTPASAYNSWYAVFAWQKSMRLRDQGLGPVWH